jgi:hypothetical protein
MKKNLNEVLNRMRLMVGLTENQLMTESLVDVDSDVDLIYDLYFKKDIDEINRTGIVTKDMFKIYITDSSILKSEIAVQTHTIRPVDITINKVYAHDYVNFFDFDKGLISVSISWSAVNFLFELSDGDLRNIGGKVFGGEVQEKSLKQEFTEERIKGSIHHELTHWVHEVSTKGAVSKGLRKHHFLKKNRDESKYVGNVNFTYFERQAQIHNIKQLHNKYSDIWDNLTFREMLSYSPPLTSVYNSLPSDVRIEWVKLTKKRMNREGLLGKSMYDA